MKSLFGKILEVLPPRTMKNGYKTILYILFIVVVFLIVLSYFSLLGCDSQAARLIQILSTLVVAFTAMIALSATDPKKDTVKIKIEPSFAQKTEHRKDEMSDELKHHYEDFPDPVESYRVQFKIDNISGFTLIKPNFAFRVPLNRKHPHRLEGEKLWSRLSFNSNLYNSTQELFMLEFADTCIISNSNLPYWNEKETITLWIRMIPYDKTGKAAPYNVEVSVNCENAEGVTQTIKIKPDESIVPTTLGNPQKDNRT